MEKINRRDFFGWMACLVAPVLAAPQFSSAESSDQLFWNPKIDQLDLRQPFDLSETLPVGLQRGGVFFVDPAGTPLPDSIELTASGKISIRQSPTGSQAEFLNGVIFGYKEPV